MHYKLRLPWGIKLVFMYLLSICSQRTARGKNGKQTYWILNEPTFWSFDIPAVFRGLDVLLSFTYLFHKMPKNVKIKGKCCNCIEGSTAWDVSDGVKPLLVREYAVTHYRPIWGLHIEVSFLAEQTSKHNWT